MSLLDQIITDLSPTESRRFTDWLACPLHNRRKDCRLLYQFLLQAAPSTTAKDRYAAAYPEASFDPARYRQLEHQLLKRLEAFLAWDHYQRDDFAPDHFLLQAYRRRGLDDHRQTRLRRYRPGETAGEHRLQFDYFHATESYDLSLATNRGGKVDYLAPEYALEKYLLGLRLRQTCITLAHQRLHKSATPYQIPRLTETLAAASGKEYQNDPFIRLFYLVAQLQIKDPEAATPIFKETITLLIESGNRLPFGDQYNLLLLAINYGLRRANTGAESAIEDTFRLYQIGLERAMLYNRGLISIFAFNNILGLALRLEKKSFATRFLEAHKDLLPEKGGAEVVALGRARLALANGEDGEALRHLQQADFQDFIHHLTARVLQLKIYFRQDSFTLVQSHISSTRKLLQRRKGIGYHLQNYRNIFALANAILRLGPGEQEAAKQLLAKVESTSPCTEKPWLLERIKEYLNQ
ncbi:MAG: hypothetical protein AAF597_03045 [Bacteroidota bacterium]